MRLGKRKIISFKILILVFVAAVMMAFVTQQRKVTIWMIGDSTMAQKSKKAYPETGWGMEFRKYFDNSVSVANMAKNGRSTKSFINEKRWDSILEKIKEGDYVFIEFGHNDEKVDKPSVGTSIAEFKSNLTKFVIETRAEGGDTSSSDTRSQTQFYKWGAYRFAWQLSCCDHECSRFFTCSND